MKKALAVLAVFALAPLVARAQKPVTRTEAIELTTKIEAIDKTARQITLKDKDGEIYYAVGSEHRLVASLGKWSGRMDSPVRALVLQSVISWPWSSPLVPTRKDSCG